MAQEIFERYEKKYMLTAEQYRGLCKSFSGRMAADDYGLHTISNIYLDTEDFELIRTSIERPAYKEKLRLRAYGEVKDDSQVFLELKKKCCGVVYKRRTQMSLNEAALYLNKGKRPEAESQIFREIEYVKERYQLKPAAYVAYDRDAWFCREDKELRVTFDRNIRCRRDCLDLRAGAYGVQLLPEGNVLMEVKIPGAMPVWMSRLFSELKIYPVSFSKYGRYYQTCILKNQMAAVLNYRTEGGKACA